jgi:hypothetical protein
MQRKNGRLSIQPHGDALLDVLNREAERQKTGILDLDPVIKQSKADGRSLLGVPDESTAG